MKSTGKILKKIKRILFYYLQLPFLYFHLVSNYYYDLKRFLRYSSVKGYLKSKPHLQSWIEADYHKLEKGLAMPKSKKGFGGYVVTRLSENLLIYINKYGIDRTVQTALEILSEYKQYNEQEKIYPSIDQEILSLIARIKCETPIRGGTIKKSREEIEQNACIDLEKFFFSRHSIRQFSDKKVDKKMIEYAVYLALKSPSVCNRQSFRVYAFGGEEKNWILQFQQGNKGFGHQAKAALIVTTNVETFFSVGERNQCWIDGGLFSMSLVYALHSQGLGTCCLNWCALKKDDQKLHKEAKIGDNEAIIMFIAVGHLPDTLRVASSMRRPVEEILIYRS